MRFLTPILALFLVTQYSVPSTSAEDAVIDALTAERAAHAAELAGVVGALGDCLALCEGQAALIAELEAHECPALPPAVRGVEIMVSNPPTSACRTWANERGLVNVRHVHHRFVHGADPLVFDASRLDAEFDRLEDIGQLGPGRPIIPDWEAWGIYDNITGDPDNTLRRSMFLAELAELAAALDERFDANPGEGHAISLWGYPRVYPNQRPASIASGNAGIGAVLEHLDFASPALYLSGPIDDEAEAWRVRAWVAATKVLCDHHSIECVPQIIVRYLGQSDRQPIDDETLRAMRAMLEAEGIRRVVVWSQDREEVNAGRLTATDAELTAAWTHALEVLIGSEEPEPDSDASVTNASGSSADVPFGVEAPIDAAVIEGQDVRAFRLVNGAVVDDVIFRDCTFTGSPSIRNADGSVRSWGQTAFELQNDRASTTPAPILQRVRFEGCTFDPGGDRYAFYCDGRIEDVIFAGCTFLTSEAESPVRIYNARRVRFEDCDFNNADGSKVALRLINSDLVAVTGGRFTQGIWINQQSTGGGWFGRVWIDGVTIAHESDSSPPINVFANRQPAPPEVPQSHVWISNVIATSRRWDKMIGGESEACTVTDCTHNGEPVDD